MNNEQLKDKILAIAIKHCVDNQECIEHPVIIDDVGFCYNGADIFAIVADPVEEFVDDDEYFDGLRRKIEKVAPEYLMKADHVAPVVLVNAQCKILGPDRGFLRMHYGF